MLSRKPPLLLLLLFTTFISADPDYSHYCNEVVNESTPSTTPLQNFPPISLDISKVNVVNQNTTISINFNTHTTFQTQTPNIFKLIATLRTFKTIPKLPSSRMIFSISGFWNSVSGKLCMVGSRTRRHGNHMHVVLKLHYSNSSDIYSSLVNGTLETNGNENIETMNILGIHKRNYAYTLIEKEEEENVFDRFDDLANVSLGSGLLSIARRIRRVGVMDLEYEEDNCDLFGGNGTDRIYFREIEDVGMDNGDKLRFLLVGGRGVGHRWVVSMETNLTLVSEGKWDEKKKRLDMVGCHVIGGEEGKGIIGDCSVRLSLRMVSKWTLRERSAIVGEMWSTKLANESGYFGKVHLKSRINSYREDDKFTYEYREIENVCKICPRNTKVSGWGLSYPDALSSDMSFSMSVADEKGKTVRGYASPLTVGDKFYPYRSFSQQGGKQNDSITVNVSYALSFASYDRVRSTEISAEGLYYPRSGQLCMIGCKRDTSTDLEHGNNKASVDCNVVINVQYAPLKAKRGSVVKGTIRSTRSESDPLYFQPLQLSSRSIYEWQARRSIWRMDVEIAMVLISNTLVCVFVGLQLFYIKKNPGVLPNISVMMLILLNLCHLIPLLLNFEALFVRTRNRQNISFGTDGWLEANEVLVRVITMIAFLLEFRLLQLTYSSRNEETEKKSLWISDKKVICWSLPLYICGGLIAWFVSHASRKSYPRTPYPGLHNPAYQQQSLWGGLKSYAGLTLDGFLLPQILFNIFSNSNSKALSPIFYVGTTIVRLLPHAYDLYRDHNRTWSFSFIYANPRTDYYSTAWDIIISGGGLVLVIVIFLQQRFGGGFFLPVKYRQSSAYEKVPAYTNETL